MGPARLRHFEKRRTWCRLKGNKRKIHLHQWVNTRVIVRAGIVNGERLEQILYETLYNIVFLG